MDQRRVREDLLRPAVDALRQALARMDEDDVPAPLRRLNAMSGRRLPRPIVTRALSELDRSAWLREETAAATDLPDGSPEHLFVHRPSGWEASLQQAVESMTQTEERGRLERTEAELEATRQRVGQLEEELKAQRRATAAAARQADDRLRAEAAAARRSQRQAEAQARAAQKARDEAEERAAASAADLAAARARVESQRALLERQRRAAAEDRSPAEARGWFPSDPDGMAEELDRIVTAARRPPRPTPPSGPGSVRPVTALPEGLRPDRRESVDWLVKQPVTWLIDGYNLAFHLDRNVSAVTRSRVVAETGRLVSLSPPATMAVVAFDSTVDEASLPVVRRVGVVFVPSADEWIIDEARVGTVAVTSDRRVREAAQASGSIGLWSEAMAGWILGNQ